MNMDPIKPIPVTDNVYLDTHTLTRRLNAKYPGPAWVIINEVRNATGYGASRSADAIAFGVWPSRGLQIIGFEVKTGRADWLGELKRPEKAETIASYCDEWWLVTCGGVANLEEIPKAWGWYLATKNGLEVAKKPEPLQAKPLGRSFLMSVVRNIAQSYVSKVEVQQKAEELAKANLDNHTYTLKRDSEKLVALQKKVNEFTDACGFDPFSYNWQTNPKAVGEVVKAVISRDLVRYLQDIEEAAEAAKHVLEKVKALPFYQAKEEAKKRNGR